MSAEYEYIVVGSGPGGGTLAARLAENGKKVLLLEAGGDPVDLKGGDAVSDDNRLPDDYRVPVFHAFSTENDAMKWDYFVRHFTDTDVQKRDPKYTLEYQGQVVDGVLYPRAGCLGGCSAHNAMIMVYPHNQDWDNVAQLMDDRSWSSGYMRKYFQKMENCHYRPLSRLLSKIGINPSKHGFKGWLRTEKAIPLEAALGDKKLVESILESATDAFSKLGEKLERSFWQLQGKGDPNDWRLVEDNAFGLRYPPLATNNHERTGTRERLLAVAKQYPENLTIELNALVTRVLFESGTSRVIGVEYLKGSRLYKAHSLPHNASQDKRQVFASQEVILSGGAFNTPQMLMLSGIGPKTHLQEMGIEVKVDLPGVGRNLQDRYEVGIVNRMNFDHWEVLKDADYSANDPQYKMWKNERKGVYTTNGAVLAVIKRAMKDRPLPDLFCFALLAKFRGYFPGYSKLIKELNYLTWAILKAHTNNTAGFVQLKSKDPTDTPYINFRYFEEGNDTRKEDIQSVVEGIKFVRELTQPLKDQGLIAEEELPGESLQTDEQLTEFVRVHAWGHHASCTCPIGRDDDPMAVLDSNFRVRGVEGLRVVDASVFPRIPGFFIVSAVYMIGEKAADVILRGDSCLAE